MNCNYLVLYCVKKSSILDFGSLVILLLTTTKFHCVNMSENKLETTHHSQISRRHFQISHHDAQNYQLKTFHLNYNEDGYQLFPKFICKKQCSTRLPIPKMMRTFIDKDCFIHQRSS